MSIYDMDLEFFHKLKMEASKLFLLQTEKGWRKEACYKPMAYNRKPWFPIMSEENLKLSLLR